MANIYSPISKNEFFLNPFPENAKRKDRRDRAAHAAYA
jgi:hypothetical protein